MRILAFDTSSNACSVALLDGEAHNFSCTGRFKMAPRQHTQLILPMIDEVLDEAGYSIKQVDVLAFGRGPGAFTGVRVATGVVQAIAYGADLPVAQISSLAAIAQGVYSAQVKYATDVAPIAHILVANDARMDEIYCAAYEMKAGFMNLINTEEVMKPELFKGARDVKLSQMTPSSSQVDATWLCAGNAWSIYAKQLASLAKQCVLKADIDLEKLSYPDAQYIAYLAFKEIQNNSLVDAAQASPVYLRNNVAKKAKK